MDKDHCRLCLADPGQGYSLLESEFANMLELLTSIKILPDDIFSTISCYNCKCNVKVAYDIQQGILKADEKLRKEFVDNVEIKMEVSHNSDNIEDDNIVTTVDEDSIFNAHQNMLNTEKDIVEDVVIKEEIGADNELFETVDLKDNFLPASSSISSTSNNLDDIKDEHFIVNEFTDCKNELNYYTCVVCEAKFNDLVHYNLHAESHSSTDRYPQQNHEWKCDACGETFKTKKQLNIHSKQKLFCPICNMRIPSICFRTHVLNHPAGSVNCELCGIILDSEESFKAHQIEMHNDEYGDEFQIKDESSLEDQGRDVCENSNKSTTLNSLPVKSKTKYEKAYHEFLEWCQQKHIKHYSETVLLTYFTEIAGKGLLASLWPKYSMLKTTLNVKNNLDIGKYHKLIGFIKAQLEGYRPRKTKILNRNDIERFTAEAPDSKYLMIKVALIFGVTGACRKDELLRLMVNDIQDFGTKLVITINNSEMNTKRKFTIVDNDNKISYINLYRKYAALRPVNTVHSRFFIFYNNNKCSSQVVGINTFGKIPSKIATFLRLENPKSYTGLCFKRSSAAIQPDSD